MARRSVSWRDLVVQADPNHQRDSRYVKEYEFSSPGGRGKEQTHEDGKRVFRGDYTRRGPYAED